MRFKLVCTFKEMWNHHVPFNSSTDFSELMYDSLKVGAQMYYKCGMSFDGSRDKNPNKKGCCHFQKNEHAPKGPKIWHLAQRASASAEIVTEVATCEDAWGS